MKKVFVIFTMSVLFASTLFSQATLIGYWKLDEGSGMVAADASGNGLIGALQHGPVWDNNSPSGKGYSLRFDSSRINLGNSGALARLTGSFSMLAWVKGAYRLGLGSNMNIVSKGHDTGVETLLRFNTPTDSTVNISAKSAGVTATVKVSHAMDSVWGHWLHIAGVFGVEDTTLRFYINGVLFTTMLIHAGMDTLHPLTPWAIGSRGLAAFDTTLSSSNSNARYFGGNISNVRIYQGALSTQEVTAIYNSERQTTGVNDVTAANPVEFSLFQNYPNPFNPTTMIGYEVPVSSRINLKIYDVMGREIATLVNQVKSPGSYSAQWNANDVPSGIYLARITAGNYIKTIKLVLMK